MFHDRNHIGNQLGNPNRNQNLKNGYFCICLKILKLIWMLLEVKCVRVIMCDSINLIEFSRDFKEILDGNNM